MKRTIFALLALFLLTIVLQAATVGVGEVEGTLSDHNGANLVGNKVILYGNSYNWNYCSGMGDYQTLTDEKGYFNLTNVREGRYLARTVIRGIGWVDKTIDVVNNQVINLEVDLSDINNNGNMRNVGHTHSNSYQHHCGCGYGC